MFHAAGVCLGVGEWNWWRGGGGAFVQFTCTGPSRNTIHIINIVLHDAWDCRHSLFMTTNSIWEAHQPARLASKYDMAFMCPSVRVLLQLPDKLPITHMKHHIRACIAAHLPPHMCCKAATSLKVPLT
jgi:hypothetical protein